MDQIETPRKNLDNAQFLKLRQATDKISAALTKRLKEHLAVLSSLFVPKRMLGTYIKSSSAEEVAGSDKAFAELQEAYAAICEKPFGLPKKLQSPLPPISGKLEAALFQYPVHSDPSAEKPTTITCPTKWIVSYQSETAIKRLKEIVAAKEFRQTDEIRQILLASLTLVVFIKHFPALTQLLKDLRYDMEIRALPEFGNAPIVILKSPVETFLPPDEFITQITQLSGIPAFQELIDLEAADRMADPLKELLNAAIR